MLQINSTDTVTIEKLPNASGYDGHCLRAYSYFKDKMPDIELAQENEKCYSAKGGSSDIFWKSSDTINYQGKSYTGDEFYEMVTGKKL